MGRMAAAQNQGSCVSVCGEEKKAKLMVVHWQFFAQQQQPLLQGNTLFTSEQKRPSGDHHHHASDSITEVAANSEISGSHTHLIISSSSSPSVVVVSLAISFDDCESLWEPLSPLIVNHNIFFPSPTILMQFTQCTFDNHIWNARSRRGRERRR